MHCGEKIPFEKRRRKKTNLRRRFGNLSNFVSNFRIIIALSSLKRERVRFLGRPDSLFIELDEGCLKDSAIKKKWIT